MRRSYMYGILLACLFAMTLALPARGQGPDVQTLSGAASERPLRFGDRGDHVLALQKLLASAAFSPGPLDGIFGPLTQGAVKEAQRRLKLPVDGMAGPLTVEALSRPATAVDTRPLHAVRDMAAVATDSNSESGLSLFTAVEPSESGRDDGALSPHFMALTFNGAPDPELTPRLLALLQRYGQQATFFLEGDAAERQPALVAQIVQAGHEIGNNGARSVDFTTLTETTLEAELYRAQRSLAAFGGKQPTFFRPPLGRFSPKVMQTAGKLGLRTVLWTNLVAQDPPDWSPSELVSRINASAYPGAIIMLHGDRLTTIDAVEQLCQSLRQRGLQSVGLSKLLLR
jgi:peptidoglycan/xylan/chitin deacetylase (PgdA/CDA1 family)